MWKLERCARAVRKGAHGRVAIAWIVVMVLAGLTPFTNARPSHVSIQPGHRAATLPAVNPVAQALKRLVDDANWQPGTSGKVNGQDVNSAQYAYVVMSQREMYESGVSLGDWALVTNNQTGRQSWARVEDVGPEGGTGEISEAAASAVGIQYASNSFTVGSPSVTVQAYAQTSGIEGSCASLVNNL